MHDMSVGLKAGPVTDVIEGGRACDSGITIHRKTR
jgi:hypothetical protein